MDIKKKLDLIAKHINELDTHIKQKYGEGSYVYFEAEGRIYAMRREDNEVGSASERQKFIIESSKLAWFDCGAW